MAQKVYTVTGMTCGHCVGSVSSEVGKVSGVSSVDVDLESGRVTVTGEEFNVEQIRQAVHEAGYTLVDA